MARKAEGVIARPSFAVSFKHSGISFPILLMESMTSSGSIALLIPASASWEEVIALTAPDTFLLIQGTSTSPPTGSQVSPSIFLRARAAA